MKKFLSILCVLAFLAGTISAQIGPNGTRSLSRLGTGSIGNSGDLQISGPSPAGNGPISAVSGLNYNFSTGVLLADSTPLTNSNYIIQVDTTVSDTVRLVYGVTNIVGNKWALGIKTLVFVLPIPPANILSLTNNQADNFVTKVKYIFDSPSANYIKVRPDTGYGTIYTGVSAKPGDTKQFIYYGASSTYY